MSAEFDLWTSTHKEELYNLIDKNMSKQTADFLKLQVSSNSSLLNGLELKQEPSTDENWAYIMEQDIRNAIMQHELSHGFELLSLTCKQLICEVLGAESERGSWTKIYVNLLSNLPNIEFPKPSDLTTNLSINEGERDLVYSKLIFKNS